MVDVLQVDLLRGLLPILPAISIIREVIELDNVILAVRLPGLEHEDGCLHACLSAENVRHMDACHQPVLLEDVRRVRESVP